MARPVATVNVVDGEVRVLNSYEIKDHLKTLGTSDVTSLLLQNFKLSEPIVYEHYAGSASVNRNVFKVKVSVFSLPWYAFRVEPASTRQWRAMNPPREM